MLYANSEKGWSIVKKLIAVVLAAVGMLVATSTASATYVLPRGTPIAASGLVNLAGNILTTTCSISLAGEIESPTSKRIDSGSGLCNIGRLTLGGLPWEKVLNLDLTWSLATIEATVEVPGVGDCIYRGTLGGEWVSNGESETVLILTDEASDIERDSESHPLCTEDPEVSGELVLDAGAA